MVCPKYKNWAIDSIHPIQEYELSYNYSLETLQKIRISFDCVISFVNRFKDHCYKVA